MINPFDYVKECVESELKQQNYRLSELKSDLVGVAQYIEDLEITLNTIEGLERKIDNRE